MASAKARSESRLLTERERVIPRMNPGAPASLLSPDHCPKQAGTAVSCGFQTHRFFHRLAGYRGQLARLLRVRAATSSRSGPVSSSLGGLTRAEGPPHSSWTCLISCTNLGTVSRRSKGRNHRKEIPVPAMDPLRQLEEPHRFFGKGIHQSGNPAGRARRHALDHHVVHAHKYRQRVSGEMLERSNAPDVAARFLHRVEV